VLAIAHNGNLSNGACSLQLRRSARRSTGTIVEIVQVGAALRSDPDERTAKLTRSFLPMMSSRTRALDKANLAVTRRRRMICLNSSMRGGAEERLVLEAKLGVNRTSSA